MVRIVSPVILLGDREVEAQISLRTHYIYIQAFTIKTDNHYKLKKEQGELPAFKSLQVSRTIKIDRLKKWLYCGWLTLKALRVLPVEEQPELATTANFWAPVQAYYAAHGLGLAALVALSDDVPRDHRAFRSAMFHQIVKQVLPFPFNVSCSGNPLDKESASLAFNNCSIDPSTVRRTSNLENPSDSNQEALIAKALMTTRARMLREIFDGARKKNVPKGRKRRNLNEGEKSKIEHKLHPTSIFDFLYRIRVRSNYDDPEMYIYGQGDEFTAQDQYRNLLRLTEGLGVVLERVIERKIGSSQFQKLRTDFNHE